jgi:transcriptional regulator with GAF, ATPase, and Fis domain
VIDYAVISCRGDHIVYNDLPEDLKDESIPRKPYIGITPVKSEVSSELPPTTPSTSMSARSAVLACLERNRWIKTKAAQELGLTRSQLLYRMKKFNIV